MKRLDIHDYIRSQSAQSKAEKKIAAINFTAEECWCLDDDEKRKKIAKVLNSWFFNEYFSKWEVAHRRDDLFRSTNEIWLNGKRDIVLDEPETRHETLPGDTLNILSHILINNILFKV